MSFESVKTFVRLAVAIPFVASLSGEDGSTTSKPRVLYAAEKPGALSTQYGLGVVAIPEPPVALARAGEAAQQACPVEVRAIVVGDEVGSSFAILAWGDQSAVMNAGESRRTPLGWLRLSSIGSDHVVLRRGEVVFRCGLADEHDGE